jgi:RNA recognition motif-containing protein
MALKKNLYVGNLPWSATEDTVRETFARFGEVISVKLIQDRETQRPRGFGFVEMEAQAADQACSALNGTDFGGRTLKVNEANPREERQPRW